MEPLFCNHASSACLCGESSALRIYSRQQFPSAWSLKTDKPEAKFAGQLNKISKIITEK